MLPYLLPLSLGEPMKIAISADEPHPLVSDIINWLEIHHHLIITQVINQKEAPTWPMAAKFVAEKVQTGEADYGMVLCWTGTGVSIAANKYKNIRAALCTDAETARGAKLWNNANVLCLSMRLTSTAVAEEILKIWFETEYQPKDEIESLLSTIND